MFFMTPGLVSITFRKLSPREIIDLCLQSELRCIEWGGDIHVPHGDLSTARRVGSMTHRAGLSVAAYGSYYHLGSHDGSDFHSVLETAAVLGALVIRVWAGTLGSAQSTPSQRALVAEDALRCADLAGARNLTIAYEFHSGTLTDTTKSAQELLEATEHPFIKTLWQPPHGDPLHECLASLRTIMPRLAHLHAFHWWPDSSCRLPLADGLKRWEAYIEELRRNKKDCPLLLEYVKADDPACFKADAETLRKLCR